MKKTLGYLKPCRGTAVCTLIFKFMGTLGELFLPTLLKYVLDVVVPAKDLKMLIILGVVMLLSCFIALFGNVIGNRLSVKCSGRMTKDLRYDLFEKITYLRSAQTDEFGVPSLISRLTSDTYYVNQMVARTMRMGVRAPILLLGGVIMTFILDPILACVLLATVPFVATGLIIINMKSIPMYFNVQRKGDTMVRAMQENASGVRVIKALSKTGYEVEKFGGIAEDLAKEEFRANKLMALSNPFATLIISIGLVAVIAVAAVRGNEAGTVLAFLSYFTIISNGLNGISKIIVVISRGAASAARIEKVLDVDCTEEITELPSGDENLKIEFKNVSFSYNGVQDNVKCLNFGIYGGQTLGIIGATGSGKSTLINLLMRFYDVREGQVLVDGKDVRSVPADELRKKFGAAFQSDFLMSATVYENVDYGRNLPEEDIKRAISAAQAQEFVNGLEGGLNYVLAQKAANLSGGQKQRLLVARALAGNPEILILDDSSSALDYATDAALRQALVREYAAVTKVIVAQRISSIKFADLILVMDDGEIIGKGTHEELLKTCGEYKLIYDTQMGGEENA